MTGLKIVRVTLLAASLLFVGVTGALAQAQPAAANAPQLFTINPKPPEISTIPVLNLLVRNGAKLYYLGERSGLSGWFIVKDSQIQMIYLTADRQTAIIGGLFTADGDNVSGLQIKALSESNKDINELVNGAARQQAEIKKASGLDGGATSVPGGSIQGESKILGNSVSTVQLSPGERLISDMKAAAGVTLGQNEKAEILMMVAPGCPNCKRTWEELREAVKAGKVQIRIVPVYNSLGGEEARQAAQLLRAANPLEAWDKHVSGDAQALAGTPDDLAIKAVAANLNLVSKWNIKGYPYLVYRGQDGRVKIVQGKPERMAAVLTDLPR